MRCLHCHRDGMTWSDRVCSNCGVSLQALIADMLAPGSILRDAYRIEFPIGRGAYGITYKAHHLALDQVVAIKEFYPREHALRKGTDGHVAVTPDQLETYDRNLQRFMQQGRILAQLNHRNVVSVSDLFAERGTAYLVMELVEGGTLRDTLGITSRKSLPIAQVESITEQLVSALEAVHEHRVYHLDIKPENVLIAPDGRVVLVDFGSARQGFSRLSTQAYTVHYAAPEVVAGDDVGPDSDIFELGMIVYEMLVGVRPPCALERLLKKSEWTPVDAGSPWACALNSALHMKRSDRPTDVRAWWQGRTRSEPEGLRGTRSQAAPVKEEGVGEGTAGPTVETGGHGDFATLAEAIERLQDDEILHIAPGVHRVEGTLTIKRPIVIQGGGLDVTVIELVGEQAGIRFEGGGPWTVSGVAFRRAAQVPGHAVEVRGGRVEFERCRFQGAVGMTQGEWACGLRLPGRTEAVLTACVVSGNFSGVKATDKAQVTLDRNQFLDNEYAGLCLEGYVQGVVRGNEVSGNRAYGILVRGDAKPVLEANRCHSNKMAGIMYLEHSGGKAWYNECTHNEQHGIFVSDHAGPILDTNQCRKNLGSGILYLELAGGCARGNECSTNEHFGIQVCDEAHPALEENCCHSNKQHGIAYFDLSSGNCLSNECLKNGRDGIILADEAIVQVIENTLRANVGCGLSFEGTAGGVVKQNHIHENGESGISVTDGAAPEIESNEIANNKAAGLLFRGSTRSRAMNNRLGQNLHGAYVDQEANPSIKSCACVDNRASGIAFFGHSSGIARDNEVSGNVHGLYVDEHAAPVLEENRCVRNSDSGVAWFGHGGGQAVGNEIAANEIFGICVSDEASPCIQGNRCFRNGNGLHYGGRAAGSIVNNQFFQNYRHGIEVCQQSTPSLERNALHDNGASGLLFRDGASGTAQANSCTHNGENGIEVRDDTNPCLTGNRCTENGANGISFGGQAHGLARENKASSNSRHGITVAERAHPRLEENECEANGESGMAWFDSASGIAYGNHCNMNEVHGILVCEDARPSLDANSCGGNLATDEVIPVSPSASRAHDKA